MFQSSLQKRYFWFIGMALAAALSLLVVACDQPTPTPTNIPSTATTPPVQKPETSTPTPPTPTEEPTPTPPSVIILGRIPDPEQEFLTAVLQQLLEKANLPVEVEDFNDSRLAREALEQDKIDGYWEFTHTALTEYHRKTNPQDSQDLASFVLLVEEDGRNNLRWYRPIRAENPLILITREELARPNNIFSLDDLVNYFNDHSGYAPGFCAPQFFFNDAANKGFDRLNDRYDISSWNKEPYSGFRNGFDILISNNCDVMLTRRQTYHLYLAAENLEDGEVTRVLDTNNPNRFFPTSDRIALVFRQEALEKFQMQETEFEHRLNCMAELLDTSVMMEFLRQPPGNGNSNGESADMGVDEEFVNQVYECDREEDYSIVIAHQGNVEQQLLSQIVAQTLRGADIPVIIKDASLSGSQSEEAHVQWSYGVSASTSISPSYTITTSLSYNNSIIIAVKVDDDRENLETFQDLFDYMASPDLALDFCVDKAVQGAYEDFIAELQANPNYPDNMIDGDPNYLTRPDLGNCDVVVARTVGEFIGQPGFTQLESVEGLLGFPDERPLMIWTSSKWEQLKSRSETPLIVDRLSCILDELNQGTIENLIGQVNENGVSTEAAVEELLADLVCLKPLPGIMCESLLDNGSFENGTGWQYSSTSALARHDFFLFALHGEQVLQLGLERLSSGTPPQATARTFVSIPDDIPLTSTHLQLSYYPFEQDVSGNFFFRVDFHTGEIISSTEEIPFHSVDLPLRPLHRWTSYTIDLTTYLDQILGQTVTIILQVIHLEGATGPSLIYIDNMQLEACFIQDDP